MPKYEISWTEEQWYTATIEADNEDHAQQMVFAGEFAWPEPYNWEIQDSMEIVEVND